MSQTVSTCAAVRLRLSLRCELEAVRPSAIETRKFLANQGIPEDLLIGCELALVEACNNAIQSCQEQDRHREVQVEILCDSSSIEIQVIDHNHGFRWPAKTDLPPPDEEHGRGLFIIQSLMDEIHYLTSSNENRLVMRKRRDAGLSAQQKEHELSGAGLNAIDPKNEAFNLAMDDSAQKHDQSEKVISTMARKLCFRSEELAAILRCSSEVGGTNNLEEFAQALLNDLLKIINADWFVLRLKSDDNSRLLTRNASVPELRLQPLLLPALRNQAGLGTFSPLMNLSPSAELEAALSRQDYIFDRDQPLASNDPLAVVRPGSAGIVRPIVVGNKFLGTLAVGRSSDEAAFSPDKAGVIHTFADILAIQILNARSYDEELDMRVVAHELRIARNIQLSLLPKTYPQLPGFDLSGFCLSAREVGGDFYDIVPITKDKILLVVADVMGKGVPAALFASTLRTLIRTMLELTAQPAELLSRVNRLMTDELSGVDMFITAQLALLELDKQQLVVASAGHCPLLFARADGEVTGASPDGMPLGILANAVFTEQIIALENCQCALLYTDGLTEARNPHGELFGEERLLTWLKKSLNQNHTAAEASRNFLAEIKAFQASAAVGDDQTLLILAAAPEKAPIAPGLDSLETNAKLAVASAMPRN